VKKLLNKLSIKATPWIFAPGVIAVESSVDFGYNIGRLLSVLRDIAFDVFVVITIAIPPTFVVLFTLWLCGKN
jgi:hypothetical protein